MSHASSSGNAADLLSRFHDQQAKRDENRIEVGTVFGACFIYHPKGCERCSTYLEHLLADIEQRPAKFSFSKDEILDGLHEAWPHVSSYITDLNEEQVTLENELFQEKADNHQLRDDVDDLKEKIQELEARLLSLQPSTTASERSLALTSPADNSPAVGYFLKEDIDVVAWLNKIIVDNSQPAFMNCMKIVFGSRLTFEMVFNGFNSNSLKPEYQQMCWITDSSTPIWLGSQITKGTKSKSQTTESVKIPQGSEFLALILKHCSLSREQTYEHIIPYMERDEEKRPMIAAAMERARLSAHVPTAVQTGESSQQRLDTDLDSYNQVRELVLPYDEAPPSGTPDVEMDVRAVAGTSSTLHNESTMHVDPELEDLYG
ncbi:hypothetical protein M422DRAFT_269796 [Sphaerobolus stellatus SS14]|uniref:Uncharacterized protein n=1 Tax=Sphaerobolus stellatus (strain SS14) TaxID=990650 RepID=A0A0C9TH74_SPHS4|nr:hypothetical protein M422DRAFT_269796 [Sphaerobolus stellatus SS14]